MTTIAWDGEVLAVDSLGVMNDIIVDQKTRKLFLNIGDYKAVAICGHYDEMLSFVYWLKELNSKEAPKAEGTAVCIDQENNCYVYHCQKVARRIPATAPYANGSGFELALGAMDAGVSARNAVEIACKRDIFSGGEINFYSTVSGCSRIIS